MSSQAQAAQRTPLQQLIASFEREHATTVRVLRAYPEDKLDLRPHPVIKTARELGALFVAEQRMLLTAVTTGLDWSKPMAPPPPPDTMGEIVTALEQAHRELIDTLERSGNDSLEGTVSFFVAPKTLGDVPMRDFLWMMLFDQVHHRGQFSVYLRMAGGRVPSIYGPTHDEPWN